MVFVFLSASKAIMEAASTRNGFQRATTTTPSAIKPRPAVMPGTKLPADDMTNAAPAKAAKTLPKMTAG